MPGRARLSLPGIPWHIIQRGQLNLWVSIIFYFSVRIKFVAFDCTSNATVTLVKQVKLIPMSLLVVRWKEYRDLAA